MKLSPFGAEAAEGARIRHRIFASSNQRNRPHSYRESRWL
jgi:hypothetical protein